MAEKETRQHRQAGSRTFDEANRTVEVVIATETPVRRYDWQDDEYFDEILEISKSAIDLSRADVLPLLDSHRRGSIEDRLGAVVAGSLRIENKQLIGAVQISRTEAGDRLMRDLADGQTLAFSVGYTIDEIKATKGKRTATRWQPTEISAVAVGADANSKSRNLQMKTNDETRELARAGEIRKLARDANIADFGERFVEDGSSVEQFRGALLEELVKREAPHVDNRHSATAGSQRAFTEAASEALLHRLDPSVKLAADAAELRGLSVPELARKALELRGERTHGESAAQLVTRSFNTTSDFPIILGNVANALLQREYEHAPAALKALARVVNVPDFKTQKVIKTWDAVTLEKVNEHGEYKRNKLLGESDLEYKIDTFGRVFGITRQALINDELNVFGETTARMARGVAILEANMLTSLLESNPNVEDGKALFHADHKNVANAAAISVASIGAARLLFRKQVTEASNLINLAPKYLVVPSELETVAEQTLAEIYAAKTEDSNAPVRNLSLIVEPRLTDPNAWYLAASPADSAGLQVAYLLGHENPYIETRNGFDIDGVEFKVRHEFGCLFTEHRGWVRNPGYVAEEE